MALHHATPGEVMRLRSVAESDLKTIALVKTDSFETIQLVVRAGEQIRRHAVAGSMSLYCIEGEAVLELDDGERRLGAGDWLYLGPHAWHAVRCVSDASLLLTILFDERTGA